VGVYVSLQIHGICKKKRRRRNLVAICTSFLIPANTQHERNTACRARSYDRLWLFTLPSYNAKLSSLPAGSSYSVRLVCLFIRCEISVTEHGLSRRLKQKRVGSLFTQPTLRVNQHVRQHRTVKLLLLIFMYLRTYRVTYVSADDVLCAGILTER
jgi:hypothetical protein